MSEAGSSIFEVETILYFTNTSNVPVLNEKSVFVPMRRFDMAFSSWWTIFVREHLFVLAIGHGLHVAGMKMIHRHILYVI